MMLCANAELHSSSCVVARLAKSCHLAKYAGCTYAKSLVQAQELLHNMQKDPIPCRLPAIDAMTNCRCRQNAFGE